MRVVPNCARCRAATHPLPRVVLTSFRRYARRRAVTRAPGNEFNRVMLSLRVMRSGPAVAGGFLLAMLLLFPFAAQAQSQEDDVIRIRANPVNVDAMVKDKKGKYVSELKAEDFTIFEYGVG